jgi:hypothetical protein
MMKSQKTLITALAAISIMTASSVGALAQTNTSGAPAAQASTQAVQVPQAEAGVNWPGAGYGVAALLGNVLYIPAKLTYAILGSVVGGGTYAVTGGNSQASDTVFRSALGGDYVLTPQMVAGDKPVNFSGPTETPPADTTTPPITAGQQPGSGNVAPIAPLSGSGPSASGAMPMDKTARPAQSGAHDSSIE